MRTWKQQLRDRQLASIVAGRWQRPDRGGSVYLIKIGEVYKIGRSVNPDLRIKSMQLPQTPDEVRLFKTATHRASVELEAVLHKKYADKRQFGEWFALTPFQYLEAQAFCAEWVERE